MNKQTILLASKSVDANGAPTGDIFTFAGPPENEKQQLELEAIFEEARSLHKFPKDIKWLGFGQVQIADTASYINAGVGAVLEARAKAKDAAEEARQKKQAEGEARQKALRAARERLSKAAVDWGNKRATLASAKKILEDAEANYKHGKTKELKAALDEANDKVSELEKTVSKAEAEYTAAKEAKQKLEQPEKK